MRETPLAADDFYVRVFTKTESKKGIENGEERECQMKEGSFERRRRIIL